MNETIKVIENLKTVRKFSERNIAEEHLSIILKSCVNAASASARQSYSVIVTDNKEVMKEIGYVGDKMLVFCVDFNRVIDSAEYLGFQYNCDSPVADFITGSTDTILAAQTAVITAKSLGIDSFLSNCVHRGNIDRIYKLLNLPEKYCFPLIALIIGYADETKSKSTQKGRLSGTGVIHYNSYHRLEEDEVKNIVQEYDNEEKHYLSLISDWKEKGYEHYLEYFYEKWCGYSRGQNKKEHGENLNNQNKVIEKTLMEIGFLPTTIKTPLQKSRFDDKGI